MESPGPLGLIRESYLKTKVEAWTSRHVELYYITTCLENTLSKILERVVADRIVDIAEEHALLPQSQMGARKN